MSFVVRFVALVGMMMSLPFVLAQQALTNCSMSVISAVNDNCDDDDDDDDDDAVTLVPDTTRL